VVDELVGEYIDDEGRLSDLEQADAVIERHKAGIRDSLSGGNRLKYYDLDPVPIANTGPFRAYGRNG
jgi:hypothetical protein